MRAVSPPESKHARDLDGLLMPEITFWTVWDGERMRVVRVWRSERLLKS
jgi:putative acetyltransferase